MGNLHVDNPFLLSVMGSFILFKTMNVIADSFSNIGSYMKNLHFKWYIMFLLRQVIFAFIFHVFLFANSNSEYYIR